MNVCPDLQPRPRTGLMAERSHSDIVALCSAADSTHPAWLEFYARFDPWIKCYVAKAWYHRDPMTTIHPAHLLLELVQDVYVALLKENCRALIQYRGTTDNSWLAYLSVICTNVVREDLRKQLAGKRTAIYYSLDDILSDANNRSRLRTILCNTLHANSETVLVEQISQQRLWQHFLTLLSLTCNRRDQELFLLWLAGYSSRELARKRRFNLKVTSIESILRRIRKKLMCALRAHHLPMRFSRILKPKKGPHNE